LTNIQYNKYYIKFFKFQVTLFNLIFIYFKNVNFLSFFYFQENFFYISETIKDFLFLPYYFYIFLNKILILILIQLFKSLSHDKDFYIPFLTLKR